MLRLRLGPVSACVIMLTMALGTATGQIFKHPRPGDIYKEYTRSMIAYSEWRVTDPNATNPWIPDPSYLVNETLPITIDDLSGAIRAEAVIDLWQGHPGTTGKKMRINGNSWIDIPELASTGGPGQCWLSQANIVVDIPLSHLVEGTNYFEGTNEGQSCHSMDWGQHGWFGIIFRIYYSSDKPHPTGSIASQAAGDSFGEYPIVSANADGGAGIRQVDFLAYYDGLDTDGDGVYQDWHYYYHRLHSESDLHIAGHVGTASSAPYEVAWNTYWVPDQAPGSVKLIARIQDNNGVWFVTDAVENLTFSRSEGSVKLYKPYDVPESFYIRADRSGQCHFDIPSGTDLTAATDARVVISTWNGICGGKAEGDYYYYRVNDWYAPEFGESHFYSLDFLEIDPSYLHEGTNLYEVYSQSYGTALYIHYPAVQVVVRYGGVPVSVQLASFTATVLGADGVKLEWKTLTETDNLGFEVQRSETATGPFTTLSFVEGRGTILVPQEYSYTDASVTSGIYYYRLNQIDRNGAQHPTEAIRVDVTTGVVDGGVVPLQSMLAQNYPNPFNPSTTIRYSVGDLGSRQQAVGNRVVRLAVYDLLGREVAVLVEEQKQPGVYTATWDATGMPGGMYFCRLVAGNFVQTNKLLLVK